MNWIAHNWFVLLIGGLAFGLLAIGIARTLFSHFARLLRPERVRGLSNPELHNSPSRILDAYLSRGGVEVGMIDLSHGERNGD
jgi:hypothetical protein